MTKTHASCIFLYYTETVDKVKCFCHNVQRTYTFSSFDFHMLIRKKSVIFATKQKANEKEKKAKIWGIFKLIQKIE